MDNVLHRDIMRTNIPKKQWIKVKEMAAELSSYYNFTDKKYLKLRTVFFNYLDLLEKQYGKNPNILATKGDFCDDENQALKLLRDAYRLAEKELDYKNCTLISSSIASIYVENKNNYTMGNKWVKELELNLNKYQDKDEYDKMKYLKKRLRALVEKKATP